MCTKSNDSDKTTVAFTAKKNFSQDFKKRNV